MIVAPHPDDEVLGCAGMMRWLADTGMCRIEIVAVTDGEASHPCSRQVDREWLRGARRGGTGRGPRPTRAGSDPGAPPRLSPTPRSNGIRARYSSPALGGNSAIRNTALVVPWSADGHPDHEAVGHAGRVAAARTGAGPLGGCDLGQRPARFRGGSRVASRRLRRDQASLSPRVHVADRLPSERTRPTAPSSRPPIYARSPVRTNRS